MALIERETSGEGQWVHTSLLEAQIFMLDFQGSRWLMAGEVAKQAGNDHPTGIPTGVFPTSDGQINIAASGDHMFRRFCEAADAMALLDDPDYANGPARSKNRKALNERIAKITKRRPAAYWVELMNEVGVPCGPIYTIDQTFADPQVQHLQMARPIDHPKLGPLKAVGQAINMTRTPEPEKLRPTPDLGQHTGEVSLEMWEGVTRIIDDFEADNAIRVIVVSGAGGRAFVSGADISEFKEKRASEEAAAAYSKISEGARQRLQDTPKPTIAMIQGYCIGGGVGTALACDLRIAAEGARFGIPAAKLGLGYGYDGIRRLIEVVGPACAREIFYTARQFSAEEALRMGLVNQVVPADQLDSYVRDYCEMIAANAPLTVRSVKAIVREAMKDERERDLALCKRLVEECFASEDYAEGRTAFMEKRKPVFKGR